MEYFRYNFRPHPEVFIDVSLCSGAEIADECEYKQRSYGCEQQPTAPQLFRTLVSGGPENHRSDHHAQTATADVEDKAFEVCGVRCVTEEVQVLPRAFEVHDDRIDHSQNEVEVVRPLFAHLGRCSDNRRCQQQIPAHTDQREVYLFF